MSLSTGMARFTYKFLKKHTRKLIDKMEYGEIVNDLFLVETLKFHPDWEKKTMKSDGTMRRIRKDKWFASYRLVILNDDGSILCPISLDKAVRMRCDCVVHDRGERPQYDPDYYKKN
jgi:hypothetical protein